MHVFIAFPFTQLCDRKTGIVTNENITFLDTLRNEILRSGHEVFLAHYRENWGMDLMGPYECTPADYAEMIRTDFVVAFPGWPISGGVHIELGWASAMGKEIRLFLKKGHNYSPLVTGLSSVTNTEIYYYEELNDSHLIPMILECIDKVAINCV